MEEIPTEPVKTDVTNVETDVKTIKTDVTIDEIPDIEEKICSEFLPRRKPGRPLGSKSKEPGKPRRKKVVEAPLEVEEVEEVEERVLPGSRPIPMEAHNDTTALMLELLRQQAQQRQTRKADLWKSWFR